MLRVISWHHAQPYDTASRKAPRRGIMQHDARCVLRDAMRSGFPWFAAEELR
jgi:hypothetical protein